MKKWETDQNMYDSLTLSLIGGGVDFVPSYEFFDRTALKDSTKWGSWLLHWEDSSQGFGSKKYECLEISIFKTFSYIFPPTINTLTQH